MRLLLELKPPLKTGVAAALAMLAYQALRLPHGYWAVISAVIVMQANLGRSMTAASNRLVGTAIGALVGAVVYRVAGQNPWALLIAMTATMWICSVGRLQQSQRLAGVTVAIVMLIVEGSALRTGVHRFVDVALGVLIALLVSVVWPSRAARDLRLSLTETYAELQKFFAIVVEGIERQHDTTAADATRQAVEQRLRRNHDLVADLEREPGDTDRLLVSMQEAAERVRDHVVAMNYSARVMARDEFHLTLAPALQRLHVGVDEAFHAIEDDLRDRPGARAQSLASALPQLEADFEKVRASGATLSYSSDELLRFYAFFYRLQQLVSELARSLEFANALEHR